ncbi:glycosyltransferase family 8 protein [bacterium D16-54]|nr:glycosyltransferase family 8 protein [bacterium D16-54]RKJ13289.1 glycosyltransferase family 8 protein [bacterium D16-56]
MRIPVVFATDENYLFYTSVAITSMAMSADFDTFYHIYILVDTKFKDENHLLDKLQNRYRNILIELFLVNEVVFQNVIIHNTHVSKATFYRLVLCELLSEAKCLYMDGDVIVTEDLTELYEMDLGDCYLAGCRDIWIELLSDGEREARRIRTGIPSMDQYVNAGVLLFNLDLLRKNGMGRVFKRHLNIDYPYEDQDILNVCCYNKILFLPAKWNLFTLFMGQIQEMEAAGIEPAVCHAFTQRKGILHYATPFIRPWIRKSCWANREWWQAAYEWKSEAIYKRIQKQVDENERRNHWEYYEDYCQRYCKIVIFGYTEYGKEFSEWVKNTKEIRNLVFCDNDPKKQGLNYKGIQVKSFENVMRDVMTNRGNETLFIIVSQGKKELIKKFLLENGIASEHIIFYKRKGEDYYTYLDKRCYKWELQDILKKENIDLRITSCFDQEDIKRKFQNDSRYHGLIKKYYMKKWLMKE